jgi:hypothetical protein
MEEEKLDWCFTYAYEDYDDIKDCDVTTIHKEDLTPIVPQIQHDSKFLKLLWLLLKKSSNIYYCKKQLFIRHEPPEDPYYSEIGFYICDLLNEILYHFDNVRISNVAVSYHSEKIRNDSILMTEILKNPELYDETIRTWESFTPKNYDDVSVFKVIIPSLDPTHSSLRDIERFVN